MPYLDTKKASNQTQESSSPQPLNIQELELIAIEELNNTEAESQNTIVLNAESIAFGTNSTIEAPQSFVPKRSTDLLGGQTNPISKPILSVYKELLQENLSLTEIATILSSHKKEQTSHSLFSQNFYTKNGSAAKATVLDIGSNTEKEAILWCINHYTGLNRNKHVMKAAQNAIETYGTGSGTSAMSCGHSQIHKEVQNRIAKLVGKEDALYFPTGYSTNVGAISAIATRRDLILFDREAHSSIIDGIKLSGATFLSFRHNDIKDLEKKLSNMSTQFLNTFVIVESAYSMSGDIAPLKEICTLKNRFNFYLYVDEAHTFGIYGPKGAGLCKELNIVDEVDFLMSTLSKSTASVGGFVACDHKYCVLMEWAANAYIFQAACSPADAAAVIESLNILETDSSIATKVHQNNAHMRQALKNVGFDLGKSQSPVIPIFINDDSLLLRSVRTLLNLGIFTVAVVYPAVKKGQGRLRFIVTASHTTEQIDTTVYALKTVLNPQI